MLDKSKVSTLKIAATYIGTIVGAGFATGQEVLQFFSSFGVSGISGIILTTALFVIFGFIIIEMGHRLHAKSHLDIIRHSSGKILGFVMDAIITFFLFGSVTAMIAGTGALFSQQFGISSLLGNLLMAVITALTVMTGLKGVINSISFVVPFLLATLFGVCIYAIVNAPPDITAGVDLEKSGLISNWVLAAILYTSYNTVISIAVLGPLGTRTKSRKAIFWGAMIGGLGLGLGSLVIYLALSGNIERIRDLEVPMIYIAGTISPVVQILFAVILIAEVYTTAVGSLYGFTSRIVDTEKTPVKGRWVVVGAVAAALLASQLGFTNLVKYLYPLVGYGGIILLACLLYSAIKTHFSKRTANP